MRRGSKIKVLYLSLLITSILIAVFFIFKQSRNQSLEVIFFDVGQGDASLIKTPYNQNILIDGGPDASLLKSLSQNLSYFDRTIDLIILSHPHDDHLLGLLDVIKHYKVKNIIHTGISYGSPAYAEYLELIKQKNIPITFSDEVNIINLGNDCYIKILYPFENLRNKTIPNLNNSSIVNKLDCLGKKILYTGDIELEVEEELLQKDIDIKADILKAGHHGSDTSSSQEFVEEVSSSKVIISAGEDNQFSHPSPRTINRIKRLGAEIFRTDYIGDIKFIFN